MEKNVDIKVLFLKKTLSTCTAHLFIIEGSVMFPMNCELKSTGL